VTSFVVQAKDTHGCDSWHTYDQDSITASYSSALYNFTGAVTWLGNGQYRVTFVPETFSQHWVVVQMHGVTIKGGESFYDVGAYVRLPQQKKRLLLYQLPHAVLPLRTLLGVYNYIRFDRYEHVFVFHM
jgi:hypothetical protein